MATDMGRGIMAPDTGEKISTSGVAEMRTIAATAASAVGDVDIRLGTMPPSSNADTFQTTGLLYTGGTESVGSHTNLAVKEPSDFFVLASNPPHVVTQFQVPSVPSDTKVYCRSKTNSATWSPWRPLGFTFGPLEYDTNMDSFYTPGNWTTGDATRTASIGNLAVPEASNLIVLGSGTGSAAYSSQIQIPVTGDTGFYFRSRRNSTVWKPWVNLVGGGGASLPLDSGHHGTPNVQRIEDFKTAYPLAVTGNKGVVSFRWDHGLTKFKQHILPLHQSLNLPGIIAMNSRNWADVQNSGMAQAEARTLAQAGLIEWANHTADHQDKGNMADMFDNIVNGRLELESQLGVPIWHFVIPGAAPTGLGGLVNGPNLDVFAKTYAGSLILAHHAVTTGAFAGTAHRKLDGRVKQGQNHYTMESRTVAEVKAQVDLAVTNKSSLWLMMHPNNINESGYLSTANVQEIMQYVKAKINSGQLANITPNQSMHAELVDSRPATRVDNTVGRRAYAWDPDNSREQMIYGNTGVRDITALAPNVTAGKLYLYREGNEVSLALSDVAMGAATGSNYDLIPAGGIPVGFRPPFTHWYNGLDGPPGQRLLGISAYGVAPVYLSPVPGDVYRGRISWTTQQPWPTSLPGTAVGTIPT